MGEDVGQRAPGPPSIAPGDYALYALLFLVLLGFHAGVNLWWLSADAHGAASRETAMLDAAKSYHDALFMTPGTVGQKLSMLGAVKLPASGIFPMFPLAGAIFAGYTGVTSAHLPAFGTVVFLVALLGFLFLLRRFLKPWDAFFAVFVISFTPMIFSVSRYFLPDMLAMALMVWAMYVLICTRYFQRPLWVALFAVLLGMALLTDPVVLLYLFAPLCVILFVSMLRSGAPGVRGGMGVFFFNVAMMVVLAGVIAGPWYINHFGEVRSVWGAQSASAPSVPQLADSIKSLAAAGTASLNNLAHPSIAWTRYPQHAMNEGGFAVWMALALFGVLPGLLLRRFRSLETVLLILWALGGWALLTLVGPSDAPRYALLSLPPLAVLASYTARMWPAPMRRACTFVFAGLLLFQYFNLTVQAYGPASDVVLPLPAGLPISECVVYKSQIALGDGYPQPGAAVVDSLGGRLLKAMADAEHKRGALIGDTANYIRLGVEDMTAEQTKYWPDATTPALPASQLPKRKLTCTGGGATLDALELLLEKADYAVYAGDAAAEQAWQTALKAKGFGLYDHFEMGGRNAGVLARGWAGPSAAQPAEAPETGSAAMPSDPSNMDVFQLCAYRKSAAFKTLEPARAEEVEQRFNTLLTQNEAKSFAINDSLTFLAFDVHKTKDGAYEFRFLFRPEKALPRDMDLFFHGKVADKDRASLPENRRADGSTLWNFSPVPPTSKWAAGECVVLTQRVQGSPIRYDCSLGFYTTKEGYFGNSVPMGNVDFATVQ